jgi:hypothetical protein
VDLLQLLILLTITGICGAFAVLILGFSPRGVMILLFAMIVGTIGAALAGWIKGLAGIRDIFTIRIGTIRIDIVLTLLGSLVVVGALMGLQALLLRNDRSAAQKESERASS